MIRFKKNSLKHKAFFVFFGLISAVIFFTLSSSPTSAQNITSPPAGSWHEGTITVFVSDPASAVFCDYQVKDGGNPPGPFKTRTCNSLFSITVGAGNDCNERGQNTCQVSVLAFDTFDFLIGQDTGSFSIKFPPPTFNLPLSGTTVSTTPTLSWFAPAPAPPRYVWEIRQGASNGPIVRSASTSFTDSTITSPLLNSTTYFWRVGSCGVFPCAEENIKWTSISRSFTTEDSISPAPTSTPGPDLPDLTILSVSGPSSWPVNTNIVFDVTVQNQGTGSSSGGWLDAEPADSPCGTPSEYATTSLGFFNAGETKTFTLTLPGFTTPGDRTIWFFADANCEIQESNETNNKMTHAIDIVTTPTPAPTSTPVPGATSTPAPTPTNTPTPGAGPTSTPGANCGTTCGVLLCGSFIACSTTEVCCLNQITLVYSCETSDLCTNPTPTPIPTPVALGTLQCVEFEDIINAEGKIVGQKCTKIATAISNIDVKPAAFISRIMSLLLGLAGGIAVLLIIAGGYGLITSRGNPQAIQESRERILGAIVGLLFVILALVILEIIGVDILKIPGFGG